MLAGGVEHLQLDVELVSLSREFYIAVSLAANFFCVKSRKVGAVFGQIFSSTNHGYRFNGQPPLTKVSGL